MRKSNYFILLILTIASCKPAKKVQRIEEAISKKDTGQTVVVNPSVEVVDSFSLVKNIITNLNERNINFSTFSAKIRVEYEGEKDANQAIAYVRMQKDSIIWLSLTGALGIEGVRAVIDKDSIKLMNKLQKTVQYQSIAYLQQLTKVPFDFYSFQNFIVGNPIFIDSNIVSYKAADNNLLVLMIGNIFKHLITLETPTYRVVHSKLDDIDTMRNRTADITYTNYENKNNFYFSTKRKITVAEKSKLNIDLDFKSYSFNEPQDYPFNIPKNYKRK